MLIFFQKRKISFQKNISLASLTTFRIGGPARYFVEVEDINQLPEIIQETKKRKIPYFILGGGSNLLVNDQGFPGLIIRLRDRSLIFKNNEVRGSAGVFLSGLIQESIKYNLTGLEWAVGIPGTLGGAVKGNAGAFGCSLGDLVQEIEVLTPRGERKIYQKTTLSFSYRQSSLKKSDIVLFLRLKLKKGSQKLSQSLIQSYWRKKKKTQPLDLPSAGCVFRNIELKDLPNKTIKTLKKKIPSEFLDQSLIPAGWLIENCGLKGKKIGGAIISQKHANFILNFNQAKAADVKKLIRLCQIEVKRKFGLELKREIKYL